MLVSQNIYRGSRASLRCEILLEIQKHFVAKRLKAEQEELDGVLLLDQPASTTPAE